MFLWTPLSTIPLSIPCPMYAINLSSSFCCPFWLSSIVLDGIVGHNYLLPYSDICIHILAKTTLTLTGHLGLIIILLFWWPKKSGKVLCFTQHSVKSHFYCSVFFMKHPLVVNFSTWDCKRLLKWMYAPWRGKYVYYGF